MEHPETLSPVEAEPTPLAKERGAEPLPGYRLLEPLGRGGYGEVWKCEVSGGLFKAIKFVDGDGYALEEGHSAADQELDALRRIKAIRHPFILSVERVEVVRGELLVVTELADQSLRDVLDECRRGGMPGIPRGTLLGLLLEAAEALDVMNFRYGLQHLDVKPGNLFLVSGHVKVGDFGQVDSPRDAAGGGQRPRGTFTPLYAAPELLQGHITRLSDQYSLAVVYQELLTGTLPFSGKNARQLLMQRLTEPPNLEPLPAGDRAVIARALSRNPDQRFPSCLEFVRALRAVADEVRDEMDRGPKPAAPRPAAAGAALVPEAAPERRPAAPRPGRPSPAPGAPPREGGEPAAKRPPLRRPTGRERRVSVRYTWKSAVRSRVRARPTYRCDDVCLRDISTMGVGLIIGHEVRHGIELFVQLPGKRAGTMTTHLAEVVHVVPWEGGSWLVGCRWARPLSDRDIQDALREAVPD